MDYKVKFDNLELTLCDADIVNPDDIEHADLNGRKGNSLFILHKNGSVVCAVWAYELPEAIEIALDAALFDESYAKTLRHAELTAPTRSNFAELWAGWTEVKNVHVAELLEACKSAYVHIKASVDYGHNCIQDERAAEKLKAVLDRAFS